MFSNRVNYQVKTKIGFMSCKTKLNFFEYFLNSPQAKRLFEYFWIEYNLNNKSRFVALSGVKKK